MIDILISENISGPYVDALKSRFEVSFQPKLWENQAALVEQVKSARVLLVRNNTQVTAEVLRAGQDLIAIGRAGVGLDNIDMNAASELGIVVSFTPDQNSISAAEHTMALLLSLVRKIPGATFDTSAGNWNRQKFLGMELYGKTLGIVGAGKIGYLVASRARAFGMNILAYDPFLSPDNVLLCELRAELVELDDLLSRADVVSCHVPASPKTDGLINKDRLAKMKPGAFFVNTARGQIVVEADLVEALKTGKIAGAALDVRVQEPPQASELNGLPNVILTPHIAAFTNEAQSRVTKAVCADIARLLDGKPSTNAATKFNVPRKRG